MKWLFLGLALVACSPSPSPVSVPDVVVDTPAVLDVSPDTLTGPASCDPATLRVAQVHAWPGGGLQLLVSASPSDTIAVGSIAAVPWSTAVSELKDSVGITGIALVYSDDPATLEKRVNDAIAFVHTLPDTEKMVLWGVGQGVELLADTTADKNHLIERLSAITPEKTTDSDAWQTDLQDSLAGLGDPFETVHRYLILVGPDFVATPQTFRRPVEVCVASDGSTVCGTGRSYEESRSHTFRVGVCPPYPATSLRLRVGDSLCQVNLDEEERAPEISCDAGHAAMDHYPYGTDVHITLEPDQKTLYDTYHKAQSQEEFVGTVTLGAHLPQKASLHFRGATSMHCARKSFKVNLDGNELRRFVPGGSGDEFYLISLCKDDRYFNQVFANRLLRGMKQFPLTGHYVRLTVNGENLGAYYLLEHVKETLLREHLALSALVRRRFDPQDKPEDIKYPDDLEGAAEVQSAYDQLADIALHGEPKDMIEALEERIDLNRYLRWVAFNTFMRNGDTIDEAFFFASREKGQHYFRHMGWDADDLFSDCHHYSEYALVDPHELIYCAEGNLDNALLRSPELYERYVDILEALLLSELGDDRLKSVMDGIQGELWAIVSNDETAMGLQELRASNPDAKDAGGARTDIGQRMKAMLNEAESRRSMLLERIELYRATQ